MGNHAKLSPSAATRWLNCPGSIALAEQLPPEEERSSTYAREGTAAHALAALCLSMEADASRFIDRDIDVEDDSYTVTEEMAEAVQVYLDKVRGDIEQSPALEVLVEQELDISWIDPDLWGTADAVVKQSRLLRVYDYKHGAGTPVSVEGNPQLMIYALGALGAKNEGGYTRVELNIIQPRVFQEGYRVQSVVLSVDELLSWAKAVLRPGINRIKSGDAPLAAGSWCKFCAAAPTCPAKLDQAQTIAAGIFGGETAPALVGSKEPAALGPERIAEILRAKPEIESWLKTVESYAFEQLKTGQEIPGLKIVKGRSSRSWADEEMAEIRLKLHLNGKAYQPRKILTPAQAEKALTAILQKQERDRFLQDNTLTKYGETLAFEDDPRPALEQKTASDVFAEA